MKFKTTRFGEIEFPEEVVMDFPDGVLGFTQDRQFILLEHDAEGSPFKWLQSLKSPDLAFIVIDPNTVETRYHYDIDLDTARCIGTDNPAGCAVMSIVNVPHDRPIAMTANLKAPLVVNVETRKGRQIILSSNTFSINTPLFPELMDQDEAGSELDMQAKAAS